MSTKAAVRQSGDVAIVDLAGNITLGQGTGMIRNTIKDLLSAGHKNILLNLKEVGYLDSSGLGELVGAYATVTNMGGRIKLLNAQTKVSNLLQVTKLYTVFVTYTDETEAVRSFAADAAPGS
jgi:anti-sigma B factor antagonist